jgi:HTH domain
METEWTESIDNSAAYRAGGRRRYNAWRRFVQIRRRAEVARLLTCKGAQFRRGIQTELARELGVSRATICRDVAYLLRLGWPCPHCGAYTRPPKPSPLFDADDGGVDGMKD